MLSDLLSGNDSSKLVVIEDSCAVSGRALLKSWVCYLASRVQCVHVVHYDAALMTEFRSDLPGHVLAKASWHDYSEDLLGWDNGLSSVTRNLPKPSSVQTEAYVFHSLSPLLMTMSAAYTCQTLHSLHSRKGAVVPIIALVHRDLHEDTDLQLLEHISSTVITLSPGVGTPFAATCSILHKRSTGKVSKKVENFTISKNFCSVEVAEVVTMTKRELPEKVTDPTANLTFNLTLTETEKQAREQLQLPFVKIHNQKHGGGESQIFYQPDEADDFDEEDPDDDLDI